MSEQKSTSKPPFEDASKEIERTDSVVRSKLLVAGISDSFFEPDYYKPGNVISDFLFCEKAKFPSIHFQNHVSFNAGVIATLTDTLARTYAFDPGKRKNIIKALLDGGILWHGGQNYQGRDYVSLPTSHPEKDHSRSIYAAKVLLAVAIATGVENEKNQALAILQHKYEIVDKLERRHAKENTERDLSAITASLAHYDLASNESAPAPR